MDAHDVLFFIAIFGSVFFVLRLILMFVGLGDPGYDVDAADGDAGHSGADLKLVSMLTIMAFLAIGGWVALLTLKSQDNLLIALGAGGGAGFVAMFGLAWMLAQTKRLEQDGTLRDFDPSGLRGEVYMRIPAVGQGEGRVTLTVKGRMRTLRAVSEEDTPIESHRPVEITGMTKDHVLRVRRTG